MLLNLKIITITSYSIIFLTCITFISCKKNNEVIQLHEDYFPLEKNLFVEYDVTSIFHDDVSGIHETTNYVLKVVIGDTVIDNYGRIAHKVLRYRYNELFQEFKVQDLWTAIIDQGRAELMEENQRTIKLVFSPNINKEWDMNAFNNQGQKIIKYDQIHKPITINNFTFDSTLTVVEERIEPTLIAYKRKQEVYAKKVGLISKYYKDIEIVNFDTLNPIGGKELYYTVKNYGFE